MHVSSRSGHQLEWVRDRLFLAHTVEVRGGGLFDVTQYEMSKVRRSNHGSNISKLSGDFFVVKAREVRTSKGSIPLAPSAFSDAKVIRAVRELPLHQQCWLRYAYCDSTDHAEFGGVADLLWDSFQASIERSRLSTIEKCKALSYLCIQDYKNQVLRGQSKYSPNEIRQLSCIPEGNWRRDWLPKWNEMHGILSEIDHASLSFVLDQINGQRS